MLDYIKLENEILLLFKDNNTDDEYENNKMKTLVESFNKYWENYQDEWKDNYWIVYELAHKKTIIDSNKIRILTILLRRIKMNLINLIKIIMNIKLI